MGINLTMGKIVKPTMQMLKIHEYNTDNFDLCSIDCYVGSNCPVLENNFSAYIKKNKAENMFLWQNKTHSCIDVRDFARKNHLKYTSSGFYVVPNYELEWYNQYWFIKLVDQKGNLIFEDLRKFTIRPICVGVANIDNIYHGGRPPSNESIMQLGWRLDKETFDKIESIFLRFEHLQYLNSFFKNLETGKCAARLT